MKNCPICGTELAEDAMSCFHCGKSFEEGAAQPTAQEAPKPDPVVSAEPVQEPTTAPAANPAAEAPAPMPVTTVPPKKLLLNTFQYMLLMLLFSIPVIGLIFLFIWGTGHPKNPSLKRFSAAVLLWRLILAVLLVGGVLALMVFRGPELQAALALFFSDLHNLLGIVLY